jgi:hypothetical protein
VVFYSEETVPFSLLCPLNPHSLLSITHSRFASAVSGGEVDLTQSNDSMLCNLVCPFNQEEGTWCAVTTAVYHGSRGNYSVSRRAERGGRWGKKKRWEGRWERKEGSGKED